MRGRCRAALGPIALVGLVAAVVSILVGCAAVRTAGAGNTASGEAGVSKQVSNRDDLSAPPPPVWGRDGGAPGVNSRSRDPGRAAGARSVQGIYRQEPLILRRQVASRCSAARDDEESDYLAAVVSELYLAAVDPAQATEALILGDCGSVEAIVRELVAQGGYQVVAPVSSRASLLGGAEAQRLIEVAVAAGLDRARAAAGSSGQAPSPGTYPYAMAHFSSQSKAATLAGADALNTLYASGTPGFGLYTFVLVGPGAPARNGANQARSRELLRVIETYVPGQEEGRARPDIHAFLVAVHPERADLPLSDQTGPELSDPMRRQLAQALRAAGQGPLARRLETRPGPFLITSPEPRLLPDGSGSPRLVVDLTGVGSEYLFALVDAFDQPVPLGAKGAGLESLRQRLLRLPLGPDGAPAGNDDWVFRIRGTTASRVAR